jgi:cell wall-active antibiotic response 4TMS protein YvqF
VRGQRGTALRGCLAFLLLLPAASVQSQSMRSFDYARPYRGERRLRAEVEFAAGELRLGPATSDRLYQLALQYDAERFQPLGSYDAGAGSVRLGVEAVRGGIRVGLKSALPQTALLEFSKAVELSLDISLGAAEAELELGDYRLAELELKSGASRTTVSFSVPNPGNCRSASISSGAGEITLLNAGNSGCPLWQFDGGVGSVTIDLGGAWPADGRIQLNVALGGVKLIAPRELGMRVQLSGFLAGFDAKGFAKNGKTYTSTGYDSAKRKVEVIVSSALGGVSVEWK